MILLELIGNNKKIMKKKNLFTLNILLFLSSVASLKRDLYIKKKIAVMNF